MSVNIRRLLWHCWTLASPSNSIGCGDVVALWDGLTVTDGALCHAVKTDWPSTSQRRCSARGQTWLPVRTCRSALHVPLEMTDFVTRLYASAPPPALWVRAPPTNLHTGRGQPPPTAGMWRPTRPNGVSRTTAAVRRLRPGGGPRRTGGERAQKLVRDPVKLHAGSCRHRVASCEMPHRIPGGGLANQVHAALAMPHDNPWKRGLDPVLR